MREAEATRNRRALPPVVVDPVRVQESGLVKDTLVLDIPNEAGNFDSVLVRRAARKLKDSTDRWAEYAREQGLTETVQPLLVLQTPNTPTPDEVGIALDTIFAEYPDLSASAVRHVLGDHSTQTFGAWEVDWIEPQLVQSRRMYASSLPRTRSRPVGTAPAQRSSCRFGPRGTTPTLRRCWGEWAVIRSPVAYPVTSD